MARKFPKTKPLERKKGTELPRWKIYIVCEGSVTEPQYFRDFARHSKSQIVEIQIIEKCGPVRELINKVKGLEETLEKAAKRSSDSFAKLYRVWGVPDVDEHPKLKEALNLAKEHHLNIALSNPCFELWGLLHFAPHDGPMHRRDAQKQLATLMPSYSHDKAPVLDCGLLHEKYPDAVTNAKRGLAAREAEGTERGNPSSNVFELTEEILNGPSFPSDQG